MVYIGNHLANLKRLIGQKLQKRRKHKGLSQEQLAGLLEVDQSRISDWERGIHRPDPVYRKALAEKLNLDESFFDELEMPSAGRSDMLITIQGILATLDQDQLHDVLAFIEAMPATQNMSRKTDIG